MGVCDGAKNTYFMARKQKTRKGLGSYCTSKKHLLHGQEAKNKEGARILLYPSRGYPHDINTSH
jgi:hypothetical protein